MSHNREIKANGSENVEQHEMKHVQAGAEEACRDVVFTKGTTDNVNGAGLDNTLLASNEADIEKAKLNLEKLYSGAAMVHADIKAKSGEDYDWLLNPKAEFAYVAALKDRGLQTPEGIQATMGSLEQATQPKSYDA